MHSDRPPICRDIPIVFFESRGKTVMSITIANKIKKIAFLRVQSRLKCAFARIADWARR